MSLRKITVQYTGDTLYLPPLEREVKHIIVYNDGLNGFEHFVPERTCENVPQADGAWFKCSECGFWMDWYVGDTNGDDSLNYCPNCGRKVVE